MLASVKTKKNKQKTKKFGGVAQAVESLLSKYEALKSNPSTTTKKEK
jgi:hypothetical protein